MGRPPLPLGTHGKVLFLDMPNGQVQARAKFRDYEGRVRLVAEVRRSRAAAERALKAELTSRQAPGGAGAIGSGTRITDLADARLDADHGCHGSSTSSSGSLRTISPVAREL